MANSITKQTIIDGSRILIVKIHIHGDGTGEETGTILIDASSYSPAFTSGRMRLIHTALVGFTAELLFDATADVHAMSLVDYEGHYAHDEMDTFGGIPNNAGAGRTGDILINTTGLGAGDHGTIILEIIKTEVA